MAENVRRPYVRRDPSKSPAPEIVEVDARSRVDEPSEESTRATPRVRQIEGGEVHWFHGESLARETR